MMGQKVRTLVDAVQYTGQHTATWNGRDGSGRLVASGIYFYTLKTEEFTATRKVVLTR
jgi:flagellar hook assembly protein FlgD